MPFDAFHHELLLQLIASEEPESASLVDTVAERIPDVEIITGLIFIARGLASDHALRRSVPVSTIIDERRNVVLAFQVHDIEAWLRHV